MRQRERLGGTIAAGLLMLGILAASCTAKVRDYGGGGASSSMSSSSGESSSSSSGGGMGGGGGGINCDMGDTVLAASQVYFGEGNSGEWKAFGFNIDGLLSTGVSTDVCQPNAGGTPATVYPDGDNGNDNSFGKNLLPNLLALYPTLVTDLNSALQDGNFTMMLKMDCLPPVGNVDPLVTHLFNGTPLGMAPKFDGTDPWPVAPELLSDTLDPQSSTIVFPNSSVTGMDFDSGKNVTFIITLPVANTTVKMTLYAAQVTMILAADRKSATARVGGVLKTEEFVAEFNKVGYDLALCGNPLWTSVVDGIREASDIMVDGTQDPSKTCDGISIGLGFDLKQVQIGSVGPMSPMMPACP